MDNININNLLNRVEIENNIIDGIKNNQTLYITGDYGCGKTQLIKNIIKKLDYDIVYYDNTYNRNKQFISDILKNSYNNINVYSLFYKVKKKSVIVLDDIDTINKSDKLAFNNLINMLKDNYKSNKNNSKNKNNLNRENITFPIILINNLYTDKKITELIKLCNIIEINKPDDCSIINILLNIFPDIFSNNILSTDKIADDFKKTLLLYINNNLNRLKLVIKYYEDGLLYIKFLGKNVDKTAFEYNQKKVVQFIMLRHYDINNINILNETNKTIVSLIFHENVINLLTNLSHKEFVNIYIQIIENFAFSDYIDRNIFQKQLWQLNDVNFYIKILYNNYILHKFNLLKNISYDNIEFTKVLTKYSNEYNNYIFLNTLYSKLMISKHDMYKLFYNHINNDTIENIIDIYNTYNINKTDIIRLLKICNYLII